MKVLYFINSLSSGGAEVFVTDLLLSMKKNSKIKEVSLCIYAGILDEKGESLNQVLIDNKIKIYNLNIKNNYIKFVIPFFIHNLVRKINPDVIHSNLDQSDLFVYFSTFLSFKKKKILFVRTLHTNNLIKKIPEYLHRRVFRFYDFNFSCSVSVKNNFQLKLFSQEIIPISNGVDLFRILIEDLQISHIQDNRKLRICVIGSFNKRHGILGKGQDLLIEALIGIDKDFEVDFLGDGTEKAYLEKYCLDKGLSSFCNFHGNVIDVKNFISKADYLVLPSRFEGLPIAAIEGVVNGIPIIVSDIEAFSIFDTSSTLIFKSDDIESLRSILLYAKNNFDVYKYNAINNSLYYREQFSIDRTSQKYFEFYCSKIFNNNKCVY